MITQLQVPSSSGVDISTSQLDLPTRTDGRTYEETITAINQDKAVDADAREKQIRSEFSS